MFKQFDGIDVKPNSILSTEYCVILSQMNTFVTPHCSIFNLPYLLVHALLPLVPFLEVI